MKKQNEKTILQEINKELFYERIDTLCKYLFLLAFAITPFYFLPSKGIQIGHVLFTVSIALLSIFRFQSILRIATTKYLKPFVYFLFVVVGVNTFWALYLSDPIFLRDIPIYCFGFLLLVTSIYHLQIFGNKVLNKIFYILFLVSFIQIIYILIVGNSPRWTNRAAAFFYNPNQLAAWTTMSLICVLLINKTQTINRGQFVFLFSLLNLLGFLTLSRAFYGVIVIAFLYLFITDIKACLLGLTLFIILFFAYTNLSVSEKTEVMLNTQKRLLDKKAYYNVSEGAERGNTRIFAYPEYLIFGAGQQLRNRFNNSREPHCTPLAIWFAYGIAGIVCFLWFIYNTFKDTPFIIWFPFIALLLFSLFHFILRIPMLWILLAIVSCYKEKAIFRSALQSNKINHLKL